MNVVFKYHLRVEPALQGTLARNYFVPGHQILLMNSVDLGKKRFFGQSRIYSLCISSMTPGHSFAEEQEAAEAFWNLW